METNSVPTDGWIDKKMWYKMEYYSAIERWNLAICNNMGHEGNTSSEISQTKKENTIWFHSLIAYLF